MIDRCANQTANPVSFSQGHICYEVQLRHVTDMKPIGQQMPQSAVGAVECFNALRKCGIAVEHADRHARVPDIGRHRDLGDRDVADTRIGQLITNHLRQLTLQLRIDAQRPRILFRHLGSGLGLHGALDLNTVEALDLIASLHVVVVLHANAALGADDDLRHIVLVTTQRF